jgi:type IV pilus assembly protein PilA
MSTQTLKREEGFTLIELLVVIVIIGVLAAIALPQFLQQQKKGYDAEARSLARNLMTHVEACYLETRDYAKCDSEAEVEDSGLQWDTDPSSPREAGRVAVMVKPFGQDVVAFAATSKTKTLFALVHGTDDRQLEKVCFVPSSAYPTGACKQGGAFGGMGFGTW